LGQYREGFGVFLVFPAGPTCSTVVILDDAGLNYAELFRLIETPADLLAKPPANSDRSPTLCELVNGGLLTMA
jgi:hypothetical protein